MGKHIQLAKRNVNTTLSGIVEKWEKDRVEGDNPVHENQLILYNE
jgi:hypothetical protein